MRKRSNTEKAEQNPGESDLSQFDGDLDRYVLSRYNKAIRYYWRSSNSNKQCYKMTQGTVLVLGAFITLISSVSIATKNSAYIA